ncbi:coenzyme F420-0:L-glutamate ligase [Patescibacteria group bacterium]|nr:coenzyme F420-0:L-glutamate ligase [Patescibacteria group bacterium]
MNPEIKVQNKTYLRYPIKTHLITKDDKLENIIEKYAQEKMQAGDIIVMSERMVAITQGRLIHESEIKETWLAGFLIKFVKKWPNDPGFRNAKKMQLVLNICGVPRVLLAAFISAITKPFGVRGLFYIICGNQVSEIDGFAPGTIPPYDKYAVLGPKDPDKVCNFLAEKFNAQFAIVDANNIDVAILGISDNIKITKSELRLAFLDNPIGQGLEQTPICIVRKNL